MGLMFDVHFSKCCFKILDLRFWNNRTGSVFLKGSGGHGIPLRYWVHVGGYFQPMIILAFKRWVEFGSNLKVSYIFDANVVVLA